MTLTSRTNVACPSCGQSRITTTTHGEKDSAASHVGVGAHRPKPADWRWWIGTGSGAGAEQRRNSRPQLDMTYNRLANAGGAFVALFSALSVGPRPARDRARRHSSPGRCLNHCRPDDLGGPSRA